MNTYTIENYITNLNLSDLDKNNLTFLLSASSETIEDWFNQVNDADKIYAKDLLNTALSIMVEEKLDTKSWNESRDILHKFRLK